MSFYIFLFLSAIVLFKELKKPSQRKKLIFAYAFVFFIGIMYNLGKVSGELFYHLGVLI
jgi:hypothetical protein